MHVWFNVPKQSPLFEFENPASIRTCVVAFAFCSPVHDLILVSQRGWKFAILLTHFVNLVRRMHRNPSKSFVLILFHRAAV